MTVEDFMTITILFGGFITSACLAVLLLVPWFRKHPARWTLMVSGLTPLALVLILGMADLLVAGRDPVVLAVLFPMVPALLFPLIALRTHQRNGALTRKTRILFLVYHLVLTASNFWAAWILWLMTDSGFMGAHC